MGGPARLPFGVRFPVPGAAPVRERVLGDGPRCPCCRAFAAGGDGPCGACRKEAYRLGLAAKSEARR